jgi:hypothetical protein
MSILPERQDELHKLTQNNELITQIAELPRVERPTLIQQHGRQVLGLSAEVDITELPPTTQSELLLVMRSLRDNVTGSESVLWQ